MNNSNFQVIRLSLGRLGSWPGATADPAYSVQLDDYGFNFAKRTLEMSLQTPAKG